MFQKRKIRAKINQESKNHDKQRGTSLTIRDNPKVD